MSDAPPEQRSSAGWTPPTVDRPVATFMVVAAVVVFGSVSVQQMPVDLMPELSYPTVTVRTNYPGAAPEEVEDEVVEPMEDLLRTVEGVVGVTSVSRAGGGDVLLRFQWDTELDFATQKVRERLGLLDFPDAVENPLILRYDPALDPVLRIAVSGDAPLAEMRAYAEDELQRELEKIEGVAMVRVFGGEEAIVRVSLDERRLQALSLDVREIVERLRSENVNVAGGRLYEGEIEYLVRTVNEFRTLDDIGALVIAVREGGVVRLRDVASVTRAVRERTVVTRVDGRESIELAIFKEADANLVAVAEAVKREVFGRADWSVSDVFDPRALEGDAGAEDTEGSGGEGDDADGLGEGSGDASVAPLGGLAADVPEGVTLALLSDQSSYVRAAIAEVVTTARNGGFFAILVLFLFLRRPYATLVIGLAIPLSVMATFAPMRLLGVSLNVMSLGGLALGIGMLVDNAIVVLESIVRCREEGDAPREAAIRGTREVGGAVVASTLTTVAVFFPIVFVQGIAGQLFGDLAVAVVLSLIASLLFALFFVPMMAVLPDRNGEQDAAEDRWRLLGPLSSWTALRDDARALTRLLKRRWWSAPFVLVSGVWVLARSLPWVVLEFVTRAALGVVFGGLWIARRIGAFAERLLAGIARREGPGPFARAYGGALRGVLQGRFFVIVLGAAALVWTGGAYERLGLQLIPELEQGEFTARVRLPVGTRLEETVAVVAGIEAELVGDPAVARLSTFVGQNEDDLDASEQGEHYAELTFVVADAGDHPGREAALMRRVRDVLGRLPALEAELTRPTLFSLESPVSVEIQGYRLDALADTARQVETLLAQQPGLTDVRSNMQPGFPEIRVRFDRERLAALGLDVRQVAEVVRSKVQGETATEVRPSDRSIDVEVRVRRDDLETVSELRELVVGFATSGGASGADGNAMGLGLLPNTSERRAVRLDAVADLSIARGPAEIRHIDGQRAAIVSASASVLDVGSVVDRLDAQMTRVSLPRDQVLRVAGQSTEMDAARRSMAFALALAVFLVYVVMASKFESLVAPLVILASVPLALVGVVLVLEVMGLPVSVVTFIGAIVLAGIVVNNAIVLVDTILLVRRRGWAKRAAIVEAGRMRLRPVLITATTTVLGLLPMALGLGEGAEIRRPLALVVIAGLSSSTLLTLAAIPALYDVFGEVLGAPSSRTGEASDGSGAVLASGASTESHP